MFNLKINHMGVNVKCSVCGKEEVVAESRSKNYKTCSRNCLSIMIKSRTVLNCECTNCGKIMDIEDNKLYHEYLKLNRLIEERDLLIYDSVFTFKGICSDCKKLKE